MIEIVLIAAVLVLLIVLLAMQQKQPARTAQSSRVGKLYLPTRN